MPQAFKALSVVPFQILLCPFAFKTLQRAPARPPDPSPACIWPAPTLVPVELWAVPGYPSAIHPVCFSPVFGSCSPEQSTSLPPLTSLSCPAPPWTQGPGLAPSVPGSATLAASTSGKVPSVDPKALIKSVIDLRIMRVGNIYRRKRKSHSQDVAQMPVWRLLLCKKFGPFYSPALLKLQRCVAPTLENKVQYHVLTQDCCDIFQRFIWYYLQNNAKFISFIFISYFSLDASTQKIKKMTKQAAAY